MIKDLFSVKEKVAVVTGGLGMLGSQFSAALSERGAKVAILEPKPDRQVAATRLGEKAGGILVLQADITEKASLRDALKEVQAKLGEPEILVNNAALDSPPNAPLAENGPFETYPEASFDKVMEVNVKGVFLGCQVFGDAMARTGRGSIVNISSMYGMVSPDQRIYEYRRKGGEPFFKPIAYSVSKSALFNMTRYLATYWAGKGVRVNTLTFGGVYNGHDRDFLQAYTSHVPLGRMARVDEYNGALLFLASDASSYMTGSNLVIDGGWTAW
ncbi:MAG TPA: SDR family oxidoreductase [Fibrobacteria bacterium]|nr:SDR family oxidoreductase [Fibrobacteria bacterium]